MPQEEFDVEVMGSSLKLWARAELEPKVLGSSRAEPKFLTHELEPSSSQGSRAEPSSSRDLRLVQLYDETLL